MKNWKAYILTNVAVATVVGLMAVVGQNTLVVTVAATNQLKMESWDNQVLIFHFLCSPKVQSILIFEY